MKFDIRNMLIIGVFPGLVLLAVSSERLLCASEFRPLAAPGESPIPPIFGTSRFSQRPSRRSISRRRAYSGCIWRRCSWSARPPIAGSKPPPKPAIRG
jgi:hypothetical protein